VDKMPIAIEDNPFAVEPERDQHAETPRQVGEVERGPLRFPHCRQPGEPAAGALGIRQSISRPAPPGACRTNVGEQA
jgi:hypothetical protein